ncbi:MAG: hypothetical protein A3E36_00265 [Candidatus Andersenbacteria bacterium RIFCSPHIGHO2_12_FULL_45_11b]|uniref:Uncharacterized protein n=1 Tax=Candidatus Andersenbacteria bacterium RIFCSPHIGHO2_12_FULL_45_11b TaxID=1797282 RepID=A0A1G1X6G0_9BACT|nr:MAG: hypothetical protein A3E36_00265 [Candidatus Andersenbacteria bacterium RIFCSPHIGHO2_12_FULL_45_11b]
MTAADPFNLDDTDFDRINQEIWQAMRDGVDDIPDDPQHPLMDDPGVAALHDHLQEYKRNLSQARRPNGGMGDDAYFAFNEGSLLRPEVVVKICIDYIKQHPEILST